MKVGKQERRKEGMMDGWKKAEEGSKKREK